MVLGFRTNARASFPAFESGWIWRRHYPAGAAKPGNATNQRNGRGAKTVLTEDGPIRIEVPSDRGGSVEPILIPKHERCFTGLDDKSVAMYAPGYGHARD
ncbi:hypothetical protein F01_410428 [Burkholderia cenocepacia]|nr:hypothetical protein F01_410428 [Burkholderia cenocepacia]